MKNLFYTIFSLWLVTNIAKADSNKINIFISQIISHPALNETVRGIVDELENKNYNFNLNLKIESAQGSATLARQIAQKFINQNPDIVVGVATVAAQSFAKYSRQNKTKLIFSSVTDPIEAGLVNDLKQPMNNTSGVSNFVPLEPQLELFKKIQPNLKKLGFLYNPGELNSISLIKKLEEICPKLGITLVTQSASNSSDMPQSATKLAQNCDAIFISNDNTALGALPTIIKSATSVRIPVYVSDTDSVAIGALAALGPNQYNVGRQTGKMIIRVLKGADINTQEIEFPDKSDLYLNLAAAAKIGLIIPQNVLDEASKILPN
jgi:putative ABC transport system substrate-binding protein